MGKTLASPRVPHREKGKKVSLRLKILQKKTLTVHYTQNIGEIPLLLVFKKIYTVYPYNPLTAKQRGNPYYF